MNRVRRAVLGGITLAALLVLALGSRTPAVPLADGPAEIHLAPQASGLDLVKVAQPVVRPGGEITYTLTITNSGYQAATNLTMEDVLPPNTGYVRGGTLVGDRVQWTIANLAGYGGVQEKTVVLSAEGEPGTEILNDDYYAWASSGQQVHGTVTATTRIVDDWAWITPWKAYTLTYGGPDVTTLITLPVGTVSEPMTWAYEELDGALHPLALRTRTAFRSFRLTAFRFFSASPDIRPTDSFSVVMTFARTVRGQAGSEPLQLYRWDQGRWRKEGISCLNEPGTNQVACNVAPQELGEFVLTEVQHDLYLPLVFNGHQ